MASIEKVPGGYRVRWREGGRNRAHLTGPRKQDAVLYKQEIERAKRMGSLHRFDMGNDVFADFVESAYWPRHAAKLSEKWQTNQAYVLEKYIGPRFAGYRLADITLAEVDAWLADLRRDRVGTRAQQLALQVLNTILNKAVRWERLASNPAALADKPRHDKKVIDPPTPLEVERVREALQALDRPGEATLVSVLAYAGLRPQEALALTWNDIRDRTLLVGGEHKTGHRSVDLWKPLAADLAEWKIARGGATHLIFPTRSGKPWTETNWSNWRNRVWGTDKYPGLGIRGRTPYAMRHTHCSLMIREDKLTIAEQAAQAGHSIQVHLDTYAHLFAELKGKGSAEDAIRAARAKVQGTEGQAESG